MKHYQTIARTLVALTFVFGIETTASAQFGGLLKKAKKAVKEKVKETVNETIGGTVEGTVEESVKNEKPTVATPASPIQAIQQEVSTPAELPKVKEEILCKVEPGEPGEVTIKVKKTGKVLGTYDRAAMRLKASNGKVYQFSEDGTVADDSGTKIGSIEGQTFTTPKGEQIRCDEIGIIFVGRKNVGAVNKKYAQMGDNSRIEVSGEMNPVVLGYFIFGTQYTGQQLLKIKEDYQRSVTTDYMTDEEYYAKMKKEIDQRHSSSSAGGKGGDMQLRRGGSIVGSIKADGTVYVGGSNRGKIDSNGNIYVGGHIAGTLRSNGDVLKGGSIVGNIDADSGNVRIKGSIVGGISNMTGDVRMNGSIIGRVEPVADLKKAAVFFFFGFW